MIKTEGLIKRFGAYAALDGLDLHVPKGAVYGLVGPNGAGKTTLIRHLAGVYRADSGSVTIGGENVFENPKRKETIAYIPDDVFYFSYATLRDMMKFYAGLYPKFDCELYKRLLEAFSLREKTSFRMLSKGMKKQAAFLLAICSRPEVMILDEPIDGLDPVMRRQVWNLILQDVAERGTTVLISSHNLRELEDVCDYVGIMHKGKILLQRSLSELQENVVKVQAVFDEMRPEGLNVLHESKIGRVETLIIRGNQEAIAKCLEAAKPVFFDMIPLSLEEVFIYELGGVDYEIKNVIL